jgi:Spy/CpxP family protein refolding chaperone
MQSGGLTRSGIVADCEKGTGLDTRRNSPQLYNAISAASRPSCHHNAIRDIPVHLDQERKGKPLLRCPHPRLARLPGQKPKEKLMKNRKWIAAAATAFVLTASLAIAGTNAGNGGWKHEGHGGHKDEARFAEKLNLNDAQKQQWKAVEQNFRQENSAFLQQVHQTREDFHAAKKAGDTAKADSLKATVQAQKAQMKQLRNAMEPKLLAILTADQRAQFQTMKAERAARGDEHHEK